MLSVLAKGASQGGSSGLLHPQSGSANSLSAISFLPGFLQSLNTSGEETSWKTVTEGRCRPLSRAATERYCTGPPGQLMPGQMEGVPGQAQPANVGFYKVFISLAINTLMTCRTSVHLRNIIHYCPLPLIINSSINDLRVTDIHFLIIIS